MAGPAWAGPVSRNIDKVDGKYRVYSAPVNYKTPQGTFAKIDVDATTSTANTLSRDKAPVKSEFKDRQIKFTPDEGKWSLTVRAGTMILTGETPSLALTAKPQKDPAKPDQTIMDGGKFRCDTTALGTKFLIPSTNKITDFSCPFILTPSKDMKIIQKGQSVWCEVDGKVVLYINEPKLLDMDLKVIGDNLTVPLGLVDFTLKDNKDGTWTYTKVPGPDFAKAKLPATYWIDVNVVVSALGYLLHGVGIMLELGQQCMTPLGGFLHGLAFITEHLLSHIFIFIGHTSFLIFLP